MQYSILKLPILFLCLSYTLPCLAEKGGELVVTKNLVNVRSEASVESEILLKLKIGRNVTEIQRQKNWIKVDLHLDDIPSGWIHKSLLTKAVKQENHSALTNFEKFMQRFNNRNKVIKKQNGKIYFSKATHKEKGSIELLATQLWLNSSIEVRNNSLTEVFKLWSKFVSVGNSVSVQVLDEEGEINTLMMR